MSDRESNRDAIARRMAEIATYNQLTGAGAPAPVPQADPRTYYRAMDRINRDRDLGIELPSETAPVPTPDPRGQDFRNVQIRQQEIEDYDNIMNNLPLRRAR